MSEAEYALGYHCGITFAGLKPASLFWIDAEQFDSLGCLRRCFAERDFRFVTLRQKNGKRLLFVFHREYLARILFAKDNFAFLHSLGYAYSAAGQAVVQLRDRIRADKEFPHEVGKASRWPKFSASDKNCRRDISVKDQTALGLRSAIDIKS